MKFALSLALLVSSSAFAGDVYTNAAQVRTVACEGSGGAEKISITAKIVSPTRLEAITVKTESNGKSFKSTTPAIDGKSDPWEMSPQAGERFYFHSGNTSDFLLFADGLLAQTLKAPAPFRFGAQEIFEQYEEGGSQSIANLLCTSN